MDRLDQSVTYLYDPLHPAVLRLIQQVIQTGARLDTPVAMCGEMAGDVRFTRLLLGMGLEEFSVRPNMIGMIKRRILQTRLADIRDAMPDFATVDTPQRAAALVRRLNALE